MINKRECKIVQDLLPNYIDKLTADDTNEFIENHLKECEENYAKKYNKKYKKFNILC